MAAMATTRLSIRAEQRGEGWTPTIPGVSEQIRTMETTRYDGVNRETITVRSGSQVEAVRTIGEDMHKEQQGSLESVPSH
jgi:hypothetical protein